MPLWFSRNAADFSEWVMPEDFGRRTAAPTCRCKAAQPPRPQRRRLWMNGRAFLRLNERGRQHLSRRSNCVALSEEEPILGFRRLSFVASNKSWVEDMRRITIALAASILCFALTSGGASAMTGPGPSKSLPETNYTPKQEAACNGTWGRYGCGPGFVRRCNGWRCWCGPCW